MSQVSDMAEKTEVEDLKTEKGAVEMDVDNFLNEVGQFGRFQIILQTFFCILILPGTYQTLIMTFAGHTPPWKCTLGSMECNKTGSFKVGDDFYLERCTFKNRSSWEFLESAKFSIVTEWDLVCDKKELTHIANSGLFIGWALGAIILGIVSDKYGRKSVLFPSLGMVIAVGFISGYLPEFWSFFCARIVIGIFQGGIGLTLFVMAAELVGPKYRALSGNIVWLFFCLALAITGLKAWLVPRWRILEQIVSAPYILVLVFWKFVPESVRWLRVNNHIEEAENILRAIAKRNRREMPAAKLSKVKDVGYKAGIIDLFRPKKMLISTLIQCFIWFVNGMVYYGVSLASSDLGGDLYRDFILTSLVEFPGYVLVVYTCNRAGRKNTTVWTMLIGAIACITVAVIPSGTTNSYYNGSRISLGMLGKFCITMSFAAIYVWSVELYPTVVRSQGMALLSVTSRCGAAAAPWVAQWLKHIHIILPFSLMGGLTMVGALLSFFLEETNGKATIETIANEERKEEIEVKSTETNLGFENKGVEVEVEPKVPCDNTQTEESIQVKPLESKPPVEVTRF